MFISVVRKIVTIDCVHHDVLLKNVINYNESEFIYQFPNKTAMHPPHDCVNNTMMNISNYYRPKVNECKPSLFYFDNIF